MLNNLGDDNYELGDFVAARGYYQQVLTISQEVASQEGMAVAFGNLGKVGYVLGDFIAAHRNFEQAIAIFLEIGSRAGECTFRNCLGELLCSQGHYDATQVYFEQALAIGQELDAPHYMAENLAGLARVAWAQGNLIEAQAWVEAVLPILETNPALNGAEHPLRAILTCARVLRASGDSRAAQILSGAHARLQARAACISDEGVRRKFLENVPEHRELLAEYAQLQSDALSIQAPLPEQAETAIEASSATILEPLPLAEQPAMQEQPPQPQDLQPVVVALNVSDGEEKQQKAKKKKKGKKSRKGKRVQVIINVYGDTVIILHDRDDDKIMLADHS
jgi:tetratricopeptide (TPR) repeat protein